MARHGRLITSPRHGAGRAPTVNDVAEAAAVSRQTVSNVVNSPERVHPQTRARVQAAIDDLGYRPNRMARNLQARASRLVGYRIPGGSSGGNPLLDRFLHALTEAARADGYHLLLFTPDDERDEVDAHADLVATGTVDGFVLSETDYGDSRVSWLSERGVPFVVFGRTNIDVPYSWVDVDGRTGVASAVAHLAARGHRRIAFIGWPEGSATGDRRAEGWVTGLTDAGLGPPDPALCVRGEDGPRTGAEALDHLLRLADPPTAVVTASDLIAIGALAAARARGVEAGAALGVVGFDDSPVAPHLLPPLTSIRQPLEQVGRTIVGLLTARIAGAAPDPDGVLLTPELVVRQSS